MYPDALYRRLGEVLEQTLQQSLLTQQLSFFFSVGDMI